MKYGGLDPARARLTLLNSSVLMLSMFLTHSSQQTCRVQELCNNMNSFMNLNEVDKGISETRGHTSPHDDTSLLCNLTFNSFFSRLFHRCVSDVQDVCLFTSASIMETNIPQLNF